MKKAILLNLAPLLVSAALRPPTRCYGSGELRPIADAGLPRYAAADPVQLDGMGSYDPDNSGPLDYTWQQIDGPALVIADTNAAAPTISGFVQTREIQECKFELVVSDGELTSLHDTAKVIIVPYFGASTLQQDNPPFDPNKPTVIYFGGGNCINGFSAQPWNSSAWNSRANVMSFPNGYGPDSGGGSRTYYKYGDMIIVYLSAVAPDYKQPIQTIGWSTGGQPAIDVGIRLNSAYQDARYAVNRVTQMDAPCRVSPQWGGSWELYTQIAESFLSSSVDGEQCWLDFYYGTGGLQYEPLQFQYFVAAYLGLDHGPVRNWYRNSLTGNAMNDFNSGVVAGAYWSVVGPGKNLQLAPQTTYYFRWDGSEQSGSMNFFNESLYPGELPEPVTLVGPLDVGDPNGAVLTCEESENAVAYQLLFGSDPYRVMDYQVVSDTPEPPSAVITTLPFEDTWWTVRARDQHGSTIYSDPMYIDAFTLSLPVENLSTGKRYGYIQDAINDANPGDEIVASPGIYHQDVDFQGKNFTLRSTNPNHPAVVAATVISGGGQGPAVPFAGGEDAGCVLSGFTITGVGAGIYCSGSSPTVTNCVITRNQAAGIEMYEGSNPTITNCKITLNAGPGMKMWPKESGRTTIYNRPTITNCVIAANKGPGISGGVPAIASCTIVANLLHGISSLSLTVNNSLIYYNSNGSDTAQIESSSPTVTYSGVQGGFPGEGNIDVDPLFADRAYWDPNGTPDDSHDDFWVDGDYRLKSQAGRWDSNSGTWVQDDVTSLCIDAGDPNSDWPAELWPHGGRINMGAYGGTPQASMSLSNDGDPADCDNDYCVDARDLLMLCENWLSKELPTAADINRDGAVDFCDYSLLTTKWLQDIPKLGLVAHWKLDETDGQVAYDSAGTNDATVHNGTWTEGKVDGALQLNGFNTYVDCGQS